MNSCSSIWKSLMSGLDGKKYKCIENRRGGGGGGGARWEVTSESESGGVYTKTNWKNVKKKSWIDTQKNLPSFFPSLG